MARRAVGCAALLAGVALGSGGCGLAVAPPHEFRMPPPAKAGREGMTAARRPAADGEPGKVVPAGLQEPVEDAPAHVDDLVRIAIERNPRLVIATFAIDAARGQHVQAGLYPNPLLGIIWDEVGDRAGPGGIISAPLLEQTIVTGRKLTLAQAVAAREIDRSTLALMNERYAVIAAVRAAFYEVLVLQERIEVLHELVRLADEAVKHGRTLLENKEIARLDLIQLEAELEQFRADAEAAEQELPAARRKLAAIVGDPRLGIVAVDGEFETVPDYDPDRVLDAVLIAHPEIRSARVGVERAQAALRRAEAEPIPDLRFYSAYIRQGQNQSNDFGVGLSANIPVWDRNQGNIRTAKAELGMAVHEVGRVENLLAEQVATAFRTYSAAVRRAERFRVQVLPKAREAAELSARAFKEGQFTYLRVLIANRVVAEAKLEYVKSLGEAWQAAAVLSGLLLEEVWPERPPVMGPTAGPTIVPIPPVNKFDK
jgi:outer membrane protein, heavy metal efflux system